MLYHVLLLCLAGMLISACGDDEAAPQTAAPAATEMPTPEPAAEIAIADDEKEVTDDEEPTYDLIDISKLDNDWWQQYSGGDG